LQGGREKKFNQQELETSSTFKKRESLANRARDLPKEGRQKKKSTAANA